MAEKSSKNLKDVGGVIMGVSAVITATTPLIEKCMDDIHDNQNKKPNDKVIVPELCNKKFPIDLEQAIKILDECGLKPAISEIKDAKPKYKDCFDMQVVDCKPKHKASVKIGGLVHLSYITENVIAESRKMFEEKEQTKSENKEKKMAEKSKRKEHRKETISNATEKAKSGISKIVRRNNE